MVESTTTPTTPISAPPASNPREVVASFLRLTIDTPDLKKARLHLSKRSVAAGMMDVAPVPPGSTYTLGAQAADDLGARIPVSVKSPIPGTETHQEMTVPVVVVEEEGEWKIDLPATMDRLLGNVTSAMTQAMANVGDAMAGAMAGALTTAFGESAAMPSAAAKPTAVGKAKPTATVIAKAKKSPVPQRIARKVVAKAAVKVKKAKPGAKKVLKKPGKKLVTKLAKKSPARKPVKKGRR